MNEPQAQQQDTMAPPGMPAAGATSYEQSRAPAAGNNQQKSAAAFGDINPAGSGTQGQAGQNADVAGTVSGGFLTVKDVKTVSRAKTLRLRADDIIVGLDGALLTTDLESFLDILFECDSEKGVMLTIYRKGVIYNVIARGMLGCTLEYTKPDLAEVATKAFAEADIGALEDYTIYEVLRDIKRKCEVIDTKPSLLAVLFAPGWLVQTRLWEALIAVVLIYITTLAVHWALFVLSVLLLALYFRRAQITIQRSFGLLRDRQMWLVIAARSLEEVQQICRKFDPKCTFTPDLVGPPEVEEAPKKRRRRRGSASPA